MKPVPGPGLSYDVAGFGRITLYFLAEVANEDAQVLRLLDVIATPHGCEKRAMRKYLVGMSHHEDQEVKFLWSEVNFISTDGDAAGFEIDVDVASFDLRQVVIAEVGPPETDAYPCGSSSIPNGLVT